MKRLAIDQKAEQKWKKWKRSEFRAEKFKNYDPNAVKSQAIDGGFGAPKRRPAYDPRGLMRFSNNDMKKDLFG